MKHIAYAALICALGSPYPLAAQSDLEGVPATHFIKHTLFVCCDTAYELTRVFSKEEFESIGFHRGSLQPQDLRFHGMRSTVAQKEPGSSTGIIRYELLPGVDTLLSCFPSCRFPPPTSGHTGIVENREDLLTAQAFIAFAFRAFGVVKLDQTSAYYFGPLDEGPRGTGSAYVLCTIENWVQGTPTFRYDLRRMGSDGFRPEHSGVLQLPEKDFKRIRSQMNAFMDTTWESCAAPGDPGMCHFLCTGGKQVVSNDHCRTAGLRRRQPEALLSIRSAFRQYSKIEN